MYLVLMYLFDDGLYMLGGDIVFYVFMLIVFVFMFLFHIMVHFFLFIL